MNTLIVFVVAVPMAIGLYRHRPVRVPPGFALWLLFLLCAVISLPMLRYTPPDTLAKSITGRLPTVAFDLLGNAAVTVILLYAGNLSERTFPRQRLVRQLGFFFCIVVAGGVLGIVLPHLQFTSPVEMLLPRSVDANQFVRSLVHPTSAQLQNVLGFVSARPAAPFGYTNTWGNCLALVLGWFVVSWFVKRSPTRRLWGVLILAVACVPIVYSLNRGLWVGLALAVVFIMVRLAVRGHHSALAGLLVAVIVAVPVLAFSPLGSVISSRAAHGHSNSIRSFTVLKTLEAVTYSPVLGLGSTRAALGSSNSIAVGKTINCGTCGNPTLGSTGALWSILIAHGYLGAFFYVGFFLWTLWVYRRDRTPIGDAGLLAVFLALWFMFIYDALGMPLVLTFLAISLLWRNREAAGLSSAAESVPVLRKSAYLPPVPPSPAGRP